MKTKKFYKKLELNKGTVAHLNGSEKKKVKGGCRDTDPSACDTNTCPSGSWIFCCEPTRIDCPTYSGIPCCL